MARNIGRSLRKLDSVNPIHGLGHGRLGALDVAAQSIASVAPTAGLVTAPSLILAAGGAPGSSMLIATLVTMLVASSINQFTRRLAAPGSLYTFVVKGLHPAIGLITAAALVIGYLFLSLASLVGASSYLSQSFVPLMASTRHGASVVIEAILAVVIAVLVVALLAVGVRRATVTMLVIEVLSISTVMAALVVAWFRGSRAHPQVGRSLGDAWGAGGGLTTWGTGVVLAMVAFIGFESSTALGPETQRRMRLVPRVLSRTVLGVGAVFIVGATLESALLLGLRLPPSATPVSDMMTTLGYRAAIPVLNLAAAASFVACATASSMALVRLLLALSVDGVLPASLSLLHPRRQTPQRAALAIMPVLCAAPAIMLALGVAPRPLMDRLIETSVTGYLVAYLLVCAAVLGFLPRIGEVTLRPMVAALTAALALAAGLVTYCAFNFRAGVRLPTVTLAIGVLLALAWWCVMKFRAPNRIDRLGNYDHPSTTDVWWGPLPPITASASAGQRVVDHESGSRR